MGFVKHAFVLSIYCLIRAPEKPLDDVYNWAMYQTTKLAGDTDTNCAIVGGVIGAYVGIQNISSLKLKKVLECKVEQGPDSLSRSRP